METQFRTGEVVLSYVNLMTARTNDLTDAEEYSCMLLIDKNDTETLDAYNAALEAAIEKGKSGVWGGKIPANFRVPLRDGDVEKPGEEQYENRYFMNVKNRRKPLIVDKTRRKLEDHEFELVYSGVHAKAIVNLNPYKSRGNVGVGAYVNAVQIIRDGERLGGSVSADLFEVMESEDDLLAGL